MDRTLRYETEAADIYSKLKQIPRTGWVMSGVEFPETVYDHTVSLIRLADDLSKDFGLTEIELDDLKHILEVHDWAEAIAGDEFVPNEHQASYIERKKLKAERESKALHELLADKPFKDPVIKLFNRYEDAADPIAKLAKEIDKYQALELALHYEQEQGIPLFKEFDDYYKRDWPFSNPVILRRIETLREAHSTSQTS